MLIDGFTVAAQLVNFLVLLWLMKRFLYRPVLDAISARERTIAATLADAAAKQSAAQQMLAAQTERSAAFERDRSALLSVATADAQTERQRLLQEARSAAEAQRSAAAQSLVEQRDQLRDALVAHARLEVFAVARQALRDLASVSLEQRITDVFLQRLAQLEGPAKEQLRVALVDAPDSGQVRSAYALSSAQQAAIGQAVHDRLTDTATLHFSNAADLVAGIELTVNGQRLAWSIDDYLTELSAEVTAQLAMQRTELLIPAHTAAPAAVPA